MTTVLSQIETNTPPQLPGGSAMRFDAAGNAGMLVHDLGAPADVLHCRVMLDATQVAGGELTIAGGIDANGVSAWQLTIDAAGRSLVLAAGQAHCSVDLVPALAWQTVEVALDILAGTVTLRLNGIERDSDTLAINPTRYAWLGGAFPSAGLNGTIDFDDWVLATGPIGTPIVEPILDHAGDPRRWLVVYNREDAGSAAWADAYRARRGVPYANLCGLNLPTAETVTDTQYQTMRQQIADYLNDNHLADQVVGVLFGFHVPGYADLTAQGPTPIASYLHTDAADGLETINPIHQPAIGERPAASDYGAVRLTGRVDAPDLATALSLIDRADNLIQQPLAHDAGADLQVDINPDNPNVGPVYTGLIRDWVEGQAFDQLRLPSEIFDATPPPDDAGAAVVWGWRDAAPPSGFFASSTDRRAICMQLDPEPQPATTVRDAASTDWLNSALQAGYAASAVASRAYSLSTLPLPEPFFEALRRGWTLAEAWLISKPFIRGGLQIVGDPLMSIGFPKAGYDVFGPADRIDQIDPNQPLAILHAGDHAFQLDPADAPSSGLSARYLVRRVDEHGRSDHASAATYAVIEQGQMVSPALPAWPSFDNWRIDVRNGDLQPIAVWPASLQHLGIDRVELQAQVGTDPPTTLDQASPAVGQRRITFSIERPSVSTRYRFRIVQGPATFDTPWSAWIEPAPLPTQTLTPLETQP